MKYRVLAKTIKKALKTFPAVIITGPRQSGKTTLLRNLLKTSHAYVNLEDPDTRSAAITDPRLFLSTYHQPIIIDEIQYVPELLSYIKTLIDKNRKPGGWILTGSQNFSLMQGVSESLAGRVAVLSLLPFLYAERVNRGLLCHPINKLTNQLQSTPRIQLHHPSNTVPLSDVLLRGQYPEISSNRAVDKSLWCGAYINTYLERDIRNLSAVGDLAQFERFLRLCAARTGQILNISELARDIGISVPTAKRWLSMLETGYQVYLLYPYYKNISKRTIKSPKLYFNDTALAAYLLGIHDKQSLLTSPHFGALFETFIVTDFWKRFLHFGQLPSLYYLRTRDGLEIDLVLEVNQQLHLFEIKSGHTITSNHASTLVRLRNESTVPIGSTHIISQSHIPFVATKVYNWYWQDILSL